MPFTFSPLPHAAAVSRIAGLPLVSREVMDGLLPELRAYAFCVTGLDGFDQLAKVRDHIAAVPAGDKTWEKARKEIAADLVDDLGGKASLRRGELLLRTHVFRSYAATRYRNLMQQVDVFPFWQYKTHGDGNVRPSHAALNGMIFPAGHPIWQRIFPPWDWGCRCLVIPLTRKAAEGIMARGKLTDQQGADAHLLKTQIVTPEMFTDAEATLIDKNQRLPNGMPLNRTPTWSDSPWSIPGSVHHDWKLIEARYSDSPEVLAAFKQWADKQEITQGKTVSMWLEDEQSIAPVPVPTPKPKLTLKKNLKKPAAAPVPALPLAPAPRSLAAITTAVDALKPSHAAVVQRLKAAQVKLANAAYASPSYAQIQQEIATARAELEVVREQGRAAIEIPAAERGTVAVQSAGPLPAHFTDGRAAVERFTHASLLPDIKVQAITGRANAGMDGTIHLRDDQTASVVAHEITHVTEYRDPATLQASRDFLRSRVGRKEVPKKLTTIYPGYNYDSWEITIEDDWAKKGGDAYSGKLYFPGIKDAKIRKLWVEAMKADAAQAFGHNYATEVLTIGMERLIEDPVAFAVFDPDYFQFTVSTLQKLAP